MITLKRVALAMWAALSLCVLAASNAPASPLTAEVSVGASVFMTGDQDGKLHVVTTAGGSISCTERVFKGTATGGPAVSEVTIATSTSGCTAFGFSTIHTNQNGCTYTATTPTSLGGGQVTWTGSSQVHLVCPTGKSIEITPTFLGSSVCTMFMSAQTPTEGHIVGKSVAGSIPMDITLEITLTKIHYTGTGSSCGNSETHSDMSYTGNSTVRCYSNSAHTVQVGCKFS
jgi:hypothetical protein